MLQETKASSCWDSYLKLSVYSTAQKKEWLLYFQLQYVKDNSEVGQTEHASYTKLFIFHNG